MVDRSPPVVLVVRLALDNFEISWNAAPLSSSVRPRLSTKSISNQQGCLIRFHLPRFPHASGLEAGSTSSSSLRRSPLYSGNQGCEHKARIAGSAKRPGPALDRTMRFLQALAAASLVASASAVHLRRQIPGFPSCADNCLNNPSNLGGCSIADEKCLCQSTAYLQSTLSCINAACPSSADQATSVQGATSLCASFGVNLSSESAAVFGSATASAGATSGSSPSAASTSAAATTSATSKSAAANSKVAGSGTYRYIAAIVVPAFAVLVL
uniref:CFEM domain-containing protein n=1 Tax=Mycena chlorophos TaxID=658473 RepID=A0ABQ0LLC9_MYCCL|nr:predicted protein [Mycena chlorophos]